MKGPHEDAEEHTSCGLGMSSPVRVRLVVKRDAQGETVAAGGDGEGVGADEWYIAAVLVVGLETELSAQLILGAEAQASVDDPCSSLGVAFLETAQEGERATVCIFASEGKPVGRGRRRLLARTALLAARGGGADEACEVVDLVGEAKA